MKSEAIKTEIKSYYDITYFLHYEFQKSRNILLNNTQSRILSYIAYGLYRTMEGETVKGRGFKTSYFGPFSHDCHIANNACSNGFSDLSVDHDYGKTFNAILEHLIIRNTLDPSKLQGWSMEYGGPWYDVMFANDKVNVMREIPDDLIVEYFKKKFFNKND